MYVCICNALTDSDLRQAASQSGAARPSEVFAACRCRAQCGTCVRTVCALLGLRPSLGDATDAASAPA